MANGSATPEGKSRLKALDMRFQDLGAKGSHLTQEKMPLAHRKGIKVKSNVREEKRRSDATENGIILERAKAMPNTERKRERGIGGAAIGKFKGGTLKLSSRDIKDIEGSKSSRSGAGKGRRKD